MTKLIEYIIENAIRGACTCGRCCDGPKNPEEKQPNGHTVDLGFFEVAMQIDKKPSLKELRELASNHSGEHQDCDPFDGKEHNYMELGAWIGDQGLAMMFMGLGTIMGGFDLMTPMSMLQMNKDDPMCQQMLGAGMLSIKVKGTE